MAGASANARAMLATPLRHFICAEAVRLRPDCEGEQEGVDAFLEESVVRRELSDNYCFYTPNYDTLDACYPWARETLQKHASDKREYIYTQ